MKRKKDEERQGERCFDSFYSDLYKERWPGLRAALLKEKNPIALTEGLTHPYYLDEASLLAASLLPLKEGDRVLDMCAAPGGKTLVLAGRMKGSVDIVANDRSRDRKMRLERVLDEHLDEKVRSRVKTANYDASRWGLYEKEAYDAILLDAPCSSERHVLNSEEHLSIWSPKRPKRLAIEQYALLSSAFMALKTGGYILYSTCSINRGENDAVIARLFKKKADCVEEVETKTDRGERLEYGTILLPDSSGGIGPMYFCLLRKISGGIE